MLPENHSMDEEGKNTEQHPPRSWGPEASGPVESLPSSLSSWPQSPALFLESPRSLPGIRSHILTSFSPMTHPKVLSLRLAGAYENNSLLQAISVPFWLNGPFQARMSMGSGEWAAPGWTQQAHKIPSKPQRSPWISSAMQSAGRNSEANLSFMDSVISKSRCLPYRPVVPMDGEWRSFLEQTLRLWSRCLVSPSISVTILLTPQTTHSYLTLFLGCHHITVAWFSSYRCAYSIHLHLGVLFCLFFLKEKNLLFWNNLQRFAVQQCTYT